MDIIWTYIAIIFAIIVRIWIMNGYEMKPFFKDGKFQLNIVGTVIVAFITAYALMITSPTLFADPAIAFITVYTIPHLFDNVVTKITPSEPVTEGA